MALPLRVELSIPNLRPMGLVVTLLAVGAILLLLEIILPGMIAGLLGLLCLIAGVVAGYYEFGVETGTWILTGVMIVLVAGFCGWMWLFPRTRMGRALISTGTVGGIGAEKPDLLNQSGTAFTQLRPSGTALIGGKRIDVVTEGGLIEKGPAIKVVAIEGMRVVVRLVAQNRDSLSESKNKQT
jgi:membrane-bound serine protease (ClpP class)